MRQTYCLPVSIPARLVFLALVLALANPLAAGEWPQILGPHRNGQADDEQIVSSFPKSGPPLVWKHSVGTGFAGVAVAGGKALVFHRVDDRERVEALDAQTGKPAWSVDFPTSYAPSFVDDNGPRCVPVVDRGRVFLFGAEGNLHAVSLKDGKKLWSRAAAQEYGAPDGYFGAGSTPIVEGDRVLVNVGGDKKGAGIVAFDVSSGKTVWQATNELASYSSPAAATVDGVRHVIFVTRLNTVSLDPADGKVRFQFPFGQRGPTVNAATPLVFDGNLFVSASYGVGATFARIGKTSADILWQSDEIMSSQYSTCVYHEGYLYGIDGRQDVGVARLRCLDPKLEKVMWTEEDFGKATLILADGKLVIQKTDGELVLAAVNPRKYTPLATARVLATTSRALPALAGGKLYVRDTTTLKCLDLGESAPAKGK